MDMLNEIIMKLRVIEFLGETARNAYPEPLFIFKLHGK